MKNCAIVVVAFAIGTTYSSVATAQFASCTEPYEKAQEEKTAGHLNAAIVHLKSCVDAHCPKFIRDDCTRWMDQVENALPSVVFAVRRDGKDVASVDISCDGKSLVSSLDGKALPVDPGPHDFVFEVPGLPPMHRQMLIREGERNRIVDVEFRGPSPAPSSASSAVDTGLQQAEKPGGEKTVMHYVPYGLTVVGVLGVAGFTVFALQGNSRKNDLEHSCSPYCQSGQVDDVKRKYQLADTCLAVGLVSAGVATYLFLADHGSEGARSQGPTTTVGFAPRPSGGGGVVHVATPF
jgi:hypothetical protein